VVRDGRVLAETARRESRSHAASLPALVDEVLGRANVAIAALDGIAVSIGPGSFTGLRVGCALAKGIAYAGALPLVGVPTLEALACVADAPPGRTVCVALDARKHEVYAAFFRAGEPPERLTPDAAWTPGVLAARLAPDHVVVGDATDVYPELAAGEVRPFATHHPRGGVVARLGLARLRRGEATPLGSLEPVYVRPPDAELPRAR
jgi:tRNA threonylcarbamoyladenosine biosynthesis protein TsaB